MRPHARRPMLALVALTAAFAGCAGGGDGPPVHAVSGTLLVDGRPAAGAEVTFHPATPPPAGTATPVAVVGPDGRFRPSTRLAEDGAPAGDYTLTVVWRTPAALPDDAGSGAADRLMGRYADPARSPLKATVAAGENRIGPIQIASPSRPGAMP